MPVPLRELGEAKPGVHKTLGVAKVRAPEGRVVQTLEQQQTSSLRRLPRLLSVPLLGRSLRNVACWGQVPPR